MCYYILLFLILFTVLFLYFIPTFDFNAATSVTSLFFWSMLVFNMTHKLCSQALAALLWRNTPPITVSALAFKPGTVFDSLWENAKLCFKLSIPEPRDWQREQGGQKERESWNSLMGNSNTSSSTKQKMGGVCVSECVCVSSVLHIHQQLTSEPMACSHKIGFVCMWCCRK